MKTYDELYREVEELKKQNAILTEQIDIKNNHRQIFEDVFYLAFDGFFLFQDGIVDCNPRAEKILNKSKQEIIGKLPSDFSPEFQQNGEKSKTIEDKLFRNLSKETQFNWTFLVDNNLLYCDVFVKKIVTNEIGEVYLIVFRDISEKVKYEAEMKRRDEFIRLALSGGELGYWMIDKTQSLEVTNRRFWEIYSLPRNRNNFTKTKSNRIHILDWKKMKRIEKALENKESSKYKIQYRIRNGYNRWKWVEEQGKTLEVDEHGFPTIIAGTLLDITNVKDTELINKAILDIIHETDEKEDLDDLFTVVHHILERLMPADNFYIATVDDDLQVLRYVYHQDQFDDKTEIVPFGNGLTEHVIRNGNSYLYTSSSQSNTEIDSIGERAAVWLGVPLTINGKTIGAMVVQDYDYDDTYQDREKQILEIIGGEVAHAMKRKRAEIALLDSEYKFRQIAESLPGVVYVYDVYPDGNRKTVFSGPGMDTILGKEAVQHIGSNVESFFKFVPKEDYEAIQKRSKEISFDDPFDVEYRLVYNKKTAWIRSISKNIYQKENVVRVIGVLIDITAQKNATIKLKASEEKYSNLLNNLTYALMEIDNTGKIIFANNATKDLSGYERDELIGRDISQFMIEEFQVFKNRFLHAMAHKIPSSTIQIKLHHKTADKILDVEFDWMYSYDEHQQVKGIIVLMRDVTERNFMRHQLQVRQKMDTIGALAGGIAHDFNNLLSVIMGNLDMLSMLSQDIGEKQKKCIFSAIQTSYRARDLIKRMQSLSKDTAKEKKTIDLFEAVVEVKEMLDKTTDKLIQKEICFDAKQFFVYINPTELNQVLLNLGTNANHAITEKGVTASDYIKVDAEINDFTAVNKFNLPKGEYAHIKFSDSGGGMPEHIKKRAFEPLFSTRRSNQKGQGLGLAMVFNIVEQNAGIIEIESEVGIGTTMHIYFPLVQKRIEEEDFVSEVQGGTERILLVEDEATIQQFFQPAMKKYGYDVVCANDGEEALKKYASDPDEWDLVVTDLIMPKVSGVELIKEIRQFNEDQKVMIITGHNPDEFDSFQVRFAKRILLKPFRIHDILKAVRDVIDEK